MLDLPEAVKQGIAQRRLAREEERRITNADSPQPFTSVSALNKNQSNEDILRSLSVLKRRDSRAQLHMSASNDLKRRERFDAQISGAYSPFKDPSTSVSALASQSKLDSAERPPKASTVNKAIEKFNTSVREKGVLDLRQMKQLTSSLARIQELDERKSNAQLKLYRKEFQEMATRQKFLETMQESRSVQKQLRKMSHAQSAEELVGDGGYGAADDQQASRNNPFAPKRSLPVASMSVIPNHDLRESLAELLSRESSQFAGINKRKVADKRVAALAKRRGLHPESSESGDDEKQEDPDPEALVVSQDKLARLDGEQRQRALAKMNEKIQLQNMQQIYKLKSMKPIKRVKKPDQGLDRTIPSQIHQSLSTSEMASPEANPRGSTKADAERPPNPRQYSSRESIDTEQLTLAQTIQACAEAYNRPLMEPPSGLLPKIVIAHTQSLQEEDTSDDADEKNATH